MATAVKNIEKEFLLNALHDEGIPVIYYRDGVEYLLFIKKIAKEDVLFLSKQPIGKLAVNDHLEVTFEFKGKMAAFSVEVLQIKEQEITCSMPSSLYKDLDRTYTRVRIPVQMQVQFAFLGDRYNLSFPKVRDCDTEDLGDFMHNSNPRNLSGLIEQLTAWIKHYANGYRLIFFKDTRPSTTEERIITETGKALFLPSTRGNFPENDPFPRKRIITESMFKRYLESTGISLGFVSSACTRFVKSKNESGIISDTWVPILFHEYVIGCIHVWNEDKKKPHFDETMLNTLYQFTRVLAYSLELNGYFEKGKMKSNSFIGKAIDISASGLLFAYPYSDLSSSLAPDSKLNIKMVTPQRTISSDAKIMRRFKDRSLGYYGCQFEEMEKDNFGYLFHCIYGKPFTGNAAPA